MSATSRVAILAEQRRTKAVELRLAGLDYRTIGDRLNICHTTALRHVRKTLDGLIDDAREQGAQLLALELARLDQLQAAIWEPALNGDLEAVTAVLKVMNARARLLGLDRQAARTNGNDGITVNRITFESPTTGAAPNEHESI